MRKSVLPSIPKNLLEALEKQYPDRMPPRRSTLEEIRFAQGALSVLQFLRHQFDIQNETVLAPSTR